MLHNIVYITFIVRQMDSKRQSHASLNINAGTIISTRPLYRACIQLVLRRECSITQQQQQPRGRKMTHNTDSVTTTIITLQRYLTDAYGVTRQRNVMHFTTRIVHIHHQKTASINIKNVTKTPNMKQNVKLLGELLHIIQQLTVDRHHCFKLKVTTFT